MSKEQEHIDKMLDTYKQYLTTKSWKRRNDLRKNLNKLEKELFQYQQLKGSN